MEVLTSMGSSFCEKKLSEENFAKGTSLVQNNIQPQNRSNSMIVKEKENAKKAFFLRMTSGSFSGMIKTKKYQNHRKWFSSTLSKTQWFGKIMKEKYQITRIFSGNDVQDWWLYERLLKLSHHLSTRQWITAIIKLCNHFRLAAWIFDTRT